MTKHQPTISGFMPRLKLEGMDYRCFDGDLRLKANAFELHADRQKNLNPRCLGHELQQASLPAYASFYRRDMIMNFIRGVWPSARLVFPHRKPSIFSFKSRCSLRAFLTTAYHFRREAT